MKITNYDDLYPTALATGSVWVGGSDGSNSGYTGGDVVGGPGELSVIGLSATVSLSSNMGDNTLGTVLTTVQSSPWVAQFAVSSNTGASFGSNATRVSEVAAAGALSTSAREDHIHDGIGTITSSSSNTMQRGTWNVRAGSGIALALTDTDGDGEFDTTTIVNTSGGGGGSGLTIEEVDGSPSVAASKLVLPNGTLGVVGSVATYTPTAGGGGVACPTIYAAAGTSGLNTQNPALTIDAAASGHRLIVGLDFVGRGATSITCTNTTFTKVFGQTSAGGSYYEIWVGVVAGGVSGTTLTVNTASSNFASFVVVEVGDALTPTAGSSDTSAFTTNAVGVGAFNALSGVTAGNFVAMLVGCDNTTTAVTLYTGLPAFWYSRNASGTGVGIAVLYAPSSGAISGYITTAASRASYAIIGEIT